MELQAGLPVGFFQSLPAFVPEQKILSTTTRDNGGIKYADVLTQDPKSGAISVHTLQLGGTSSGNAKSLSTVQERQAHAVSQFSDAFVPGATLDDGTPLLDANGFVTPAAWKAAIKDAPSEGLTREAFIEAFGHLLYSKSGKIDPSYGLTGKEQKSLTG
jgi:hypothetical protein